MSQQQRLGLVAFGGVGCLGLLVCLVIVLAVQASKPKTEPTTMNASKPTENWKILITGTLMGAQPSCREGWQDPTEKQVPLPARFDLSCLVMEKGKYHCGMLKNVTKAEYEAKYLPWVGKKINLSGVPDPGSTKASYLLSDAEVSLAVTLP